MVHQAIDRYRLTVNALERYLRTKFPHVRCTVKEQDDDTYSVELPTKLTEQEIEQLRSS